jgi:hypothetical protein
MIFLDTDKPETFPKELMDCLNQNALQGLSQTFVIFEKSDVPSFKEAVETCITAILTALKNKDRNFSFRSCRNHFSSFVQHNYDGKGLCIKDGKCVEGFDLKTPAYRLSYTKILAYTTSNTTSNSKSEFIIDQDNNDPDYAAAHYEDMFTKRYKFTAKECLSWAIMASSDSTSAIDADMYLWDSDTNKFVNFKKHIQEVANELLDVSYGLAFIGAIMLLFQSKDCVDNKACVRGYNQFLRTGSAYGFKKSQELECWARLYNCFAAEIPYAIYCMVDPNDFAENAALYNIHHPSLDKSDNKTYAVKYTYEEYGYDYKAGKKLAKDLFACCQNTFSLVLFGENDTLFGTNIKYSYYKSHHQAKKENILSALFSIDPDLTLNWVKSAFLSRKVKNVSNCGLTEQDGPDIQYRISAKEFVNWLDQNKIAENLKTVKLIRDLSPFFDDLSAFSSILVKWQFDDDKSVGAQAVESIDTLIRNREYYSEQAKIKRFNKNNQLWADAIYPFWVRAVHYSNMMQEFKRLTDKRHQQLAIDIDTIDGNYDD